MTDKLPLFQHRNGQWAKKRKGKLHYFGKDIDAALKRFEKEWPKILAGVEVKEDDTRPTLRQLGNLFASEKALLVTRGKLKARSHAENLKSIERMMEIVGKDIPAEALQPAHFAKIENGLYEPVKRTTKVRGGVRGRVVKQRSPVTVANDIRRLRSFFKWCEINRYIPKPYYGTSFALPTANEMRKSRKKPELLTPEQIKNILDECSVGLKPIVLLGINGAMGATDISNIRLNQLPELKGEVCLDLPRGKTGADRRFVLWPETIEAIKAYLKVRPAAFPEARDRLFVTTGRVAWVRGANGEHDAITKAFTVTRKAAGVPHGTFYDLRRAFQTTGAETREYRAVSRVMGHVVYETDMSGRYTVKIPDEQIRTVCNHVRQWLFGK